MGVAIRRSAVALLTVAALTACKPDSPSQNGNQNSEDEFFDLNQGLQNPRIGSDGGNFINRMALNVV